MKANTVALSDMALETVSGGGIQNALALGGWGLVQGGAGGAIAGGPVGAAGVGVIGGVVGFVAGMFIPDGKSASGGGRRLIR